jgi:hypothetical protein
VKLNIDETKRFYLMLGIAAGVLLLVMGYDSSTRGEAAATWELSQDAEEQLDEAKDKLSGREGLAEKKNRILKDEFMPSVKAKLQFPGTISSAKDTDQAVLQLREDLRSSQKSVGYEAQRKNIALPTGDWDIGNMIRQSHTEEEVIELSIRLSMTSAVLGKCIESNVRQVRKVQQKSVVVENIEGSKTKVIRHIPLYVEFTGDLYSLANVMLSFQKEGSFLELRACEVDDSAGGGQILAKIELAAVRMVDRSAAEKAPKERPGGRDGREGRPDVRPPGGGGRRRF